MTREQDLAAQVAAQRVRLAQVTTILQEICESAGSMGYRRDASGEFRIVATTVIERAQEALNALDTGEIRKGGIP